MCCPCSTSYQIKRIAKTTKRLTSNHTPPTIWHLFLQLIIHHYNHTPIPLQHLPLSDFIMKQKEIGIYHFIRGKISKYIIPLIEHHYNLKVPNRHYVNAWIDYNQLKHQSLTNPHHFCNQINESTTQSKNYALDSVTKKNLVSNIQWTAK